MSKSWPPSEVKVPAVDQRAQRRLSRAGQRRQVQAVVSVRVPTGGVGARAEERARRIRRVGQRGALSTFGVFAFGVTDVKLSV